MKLLSTMEFGAESGLCCRQSRLRGVVGGVVFCAVLIGGAVLCWYLGAPRIFPIVWGVMAGVVCPIILYITLAKFTDANWVMRIRPDGLYINLHSFQDRPTDEAAGVLHLPYREIAHAHRHIDKWTTPRDIGNSSTSWKQVSLDLHVKSDTEDLSQALARIRVACKSGYRPVSTPAEGVIRIAWRGPGQDVAPSLDKVLAEMSPYVQVTEKTRTDRPNWLQLSDGELDELVRLLVHSGDSMAASQLLTRRRGCSATEAHLAIESLAAKV